MNLIEKINKMEKALRFYADGYHYKQTESGDIELETGEIAEKALVECGYKSNRVELPTEDKYYHPEYMEGKWLANIIKYMNAIVVKL